MSRSYGGVSAEERVAARRARLVAAARELLAQAGWRGTSLRAVCARSGLADRYFYESFESRDALLTATRSTSPITCSQTAVSSASRLSKLS